MSQTTPYVMSPELREIVITIADDFGGKPAAYAAHPYLDALLDTEIGAASYDQDDVHGMLLRLRGNIRGWRGPVAKATKAQLDAILAVHTSNPIRRALDTADRVIAAQNALVTA